MKPRTLIVSGRFRLDLDPFAREVWPDVTVYVPAADGKSARVTGDEARIREVAERHGLDVRVA